LPELSVDYRGDSLPHAASPQGLGPSLHGIWHEVRGIARDGLLLAALEARRAGRAFVRMVAYGVMAGILVVTAWLALVGAGVLAATSAGAALPVALGMAALCNLLIAGFLVWLIKRWDAQLLFVATLRQLRDLPQAQEKS
jgi:hypothetical protein